MKARKYKYANGGSISELGKQTKARILESHPGGTDERFRADLKNKVNAINAGATLTGPATRGGRRNRRAP